MNVVSADRPLIDTALLDQDFFFAHRFRAFQSV
jgi:hypothetical protein